MLNGVASSPIVSSRSASWPSMARRVGSASAWNTASRWARCSTMWFNIDALGGLSTDRFNLFLWNSPGSSARPGTLLGGLAGTDALLDIELQDVVEPIEGPTQRDPPGQFDDLGFGEMLAKAGEDLVAGLVPVVGHRDGIF